MFPLTHGPPNILPNSLAHVPLSFILPPSTHPDTQPVAPISSITNRRPPRQLNTNNHHYRTLPNAGLERALNGRLPLGMDLVLEEHDLSDDENEMACKIRDIREYGRTFLIPIGCRQTQEEIDAIQSRSPSPTPASNAEDNVHRPGENEDELGSVGALNPDDQPDLDGDISDEDLDENQDISED